MRNWLLLMIFTSVCFLHAKPQNKSKTNTIPITTQQERRKILMTCKNFTNAKTETNFEPHNLFIYDQEGIIETPIEELPINQTASSDNNVNELIILKEVGLALKPSGRALINGKYLLCIRGSRTLKVGDYINATYDGKNFKIHVQEILKNQFTLSLNHYSLSFNY